MDQRSKKITTNPMPINHGNKYPRRLLFKPLSNNKDEPTMYVKNIKVNIT